MDYVVDKYITEQVADFISHPQSTQYNDLVYKKALLHLIDCLWCFIASKDTPTGKLYLEYWELTQVADWNTLFLSTQCKWLLPNNAFVNAGMISAADYDDTSVSWGHPAATVIGAALAIAWTQNITLGDFLEAIIRGYDVIHFVKRSTEPSWERYQEVHGIWTSQAFWAFTVAAHLLRLSTQQIQYGLWLAAAFSPVPHACKYGWQEERLITIKDNVAIAAQSGVQAALLASMNFVGSDSIFDWIKSFAVMASSDQNNFEKYIQDIDSKSILLTSIKPYPCCRWIHGVLDAISGLWINFSPHASEIDSIEIECMSSICDIFNNPNPFGHIEWQFSIQQNVALKLLNVPRNSWNSPDRLDNISTQLATLREKIKLIPNKTYQDIYLTHAKDPSWIPFSIRIRTDSGEYFAYRECSSGGVDNPLWEDELIKKFLDNTHSSNVWNSFLHDLRNLKQEESISDFLFKY